MKNVIMTDKTKYHGPIDVFSGSILTWLVNIILNLRVLLSTRLQTTVFSVCKISLIVQH